MRIAIPFLIAGVFAAPSARADSPAPLPGWSLSAGLTSAASSSGLVTASIPSAASTEAVVQFGPPTAVFAVEHRLAGDLWLLMLATDAVSDTSNMSAPASDNGSMVTTANIIDTNTLTLALGLRHGFVHLGRVTLSWFAMLGGGWSYQSNYTKVTTVMTPALTTQTATTAQTTFTFNSSDWAGTFSGGFAVDVALIDNLSVQVSTPLASVAYNTVTLREPNTDGSATLGPPTTQNAWKAGLVLAPTLLLRLAF